MDPFTIGAIISSVVAAGASIAGNIRQKRETERSRKWQEDFWQKTYDTQLEDQLKHNSYEGQVNHLKSAGLNRNLAMSGGVTPYSAPAGSTGDGSQSQTHGFNLSSDPLTFAEVSNLNADTKVKEADAKLKEADASKRKVETDTMTYLLEKLPERIRLEFDNMRSEMDERWSNVDLNDSSRAKMAEEMKVFQKQVEDLTQQIAESKSRIAKNNTEMQLMKVTMKTQGIYAQCQAEQTILNALQTKLNAYGLQLTEKGLQIQESVANSNISVNEFQKKLIGAETALKELEAQYKGQENVREWIKVLSSSIRDLGVGLGSATGGIKDISSMMSVPFKVGF